MANLSRADKGWVILRSFNQLLHSDADKEQAHVEADKLVVRALREIGGEVGEKIAACWEQAEKDHGGWWYS